MCAQLRFARRPHRLKRLFHSPPFQTGPGVLLTFDDGPHPEHTPAVLDRLRDHGLKAVFFLIGSRIAFVPHLVERIAAEGHALGNHTWSHPRLGWADFTRARREVGECQSLIPAARFFRPPFGRLTPGLWLAARKNSLKCAHWTLDSNDWQCRSKEDAQACAAEAASLIRPGDVVLFHDAHPWIEPILDVVLPAIACKGFT